MLERKEAGWNAEGGGAGLPNRRGKHPNGAGVEQAFLACIQGVATSS